MLLVSPSVFQSSACIAEIKKAHELLSITTADLVSINLCNRFPLIHFMAIFHFLSFFYFLLQIFFPVIVQRHWVLICVNLLYKTINFFDSVKIASDHDVVRMIQNLVWFSIPSDFNQCLSIINYVVYKILIVLLF